MASFIELGARAWFKDNNVWIPCTAGQSDGVNQSFKGDNGQDFSIAGSSIGPQTCTIMHKTSIESVEDMATLGDLHDGAILYNIKSRYKNNDIYSYIGSILAAINPYQRFPALYTDEKIREYKDKPIGELAPHIYALANEAYYSLWKKDRNQVMLISGESGAGKTESTKLILQFLSFLSNEVQNAKGAVDTKTFEDKVIQSSPILEAFGNAKTVYNNNSSRFGKFISIAFTTGGFIEGGKIIDYLLEKNRVVRQNKGERNFHIFYNLTSSEQKAKFGIKTDAVSYHYLAQSGVTSDPTINDVEDWKRVREGFATMNFTDDQLDDVVNILAAVLLLGNVTYVQKGGAQVETMDVVKSVAALLSIESGALADSLTQLQRTLRGELIQTPLDVAQAADARDSLSMALYSKLFTFIIKKINVSLKGSETFHSIGVLDIFGFENFTKNFLEQFNINYANEKLQQYFNRHIFSLEQLEYDKEGIPWDEIDFVDNGACLDLVERKLGIVSLIDEESRMPKGTDESLLHKLHKSCLEGGSESAAHYIKPKMQVPVFGIRHYAGEVHYEITGLVDKNRDTFREDLTTMMQSSTNDFVFDLFESTEQGGATGGRSTARKKATLTMQFKNSLTQLMKLLSAANPYFVRCLKPNMEKVPNSFQDKVVMNQLRYSGMLETVRIRRAGYPVRREFADFLFRYRALAAGMSKDLSDKDQCAEVFKTIDASGKEWKMGKTKAFFREKIEIKLEAARQEALKATLAKIQAAVLSKAARVRFGRILEATVRLQTWWKCGMYRRQFLKLRRNAVLIQAHFKGYKSRAMYADMLERKRIELERKREVERRAEEEYLAEIARRVEEARLAEIKRQEEIKRLEAEAAEAAKQSSEAAAAAAKKLEQEKAAQEAAKAAEEAAVAKAKQDAENAAKAKSEASAADKAKEEASIKDAMAKASELQVEQDKAAALKREAEERDKLAQEFEKKQAIARAQQAEMQDDDYGGGEDNDENLEEFDDDDGFADYKDGALGMYKGVLKNLKKRWCILNDGMFMWFKGAQNFIKAGWLTKMGGGTATLGRKNWKRRWMTLKMGELHYHPSEDEDATILGIVDIQGCERIVSSNHEKLPVKKDFAFSIITKKRTYFMAADTSEECDDWVNCLNSVNGKTDEEILELQRSAAVDPRNAVGSIELDDIISVGAVDKTDAQGHPVFVVMCSNSVTKFVAADDDDLDDWVRVLTPKGAMDNGGDEEEPIEHGFLMKGGGQSGLTKKKRYFALRGDVLSYYKGTDVGSFVGSIALNSLCSIEPPDEGKAEKSNEWKFVLHSRRKSYELYAKTQADMNRWIIALQDVIDNCPIIETPTEQLIDELKVATPQEVEAIYGSQKTLTYSSVPLRAPLLPLPYGETFTSPGGRVYGTLQQEALKISASVLPVALTGDVKRYGDPIKDPITLIKGICQACFDVPKLRNEVYCQVIKLTSCFPEPGSPLNLTHWYLLAALCVSFLPSRKFARFLRFHLRRCLESAEGSDEDVSKLANFCLDAIKKTKVRDFPPSTEEVKGIMAGGGLKVSVTIVGGNKIDLPISSSTTCGEVVAMVKDQLDLNNCSNGFGLFEGCGMVSKYLDDKSYVSDVLSKWEKYIDHGINPDGGTWSLVFKLFSFYDPLNLKLSKVEREFLFEQAFESVLNKKFPADDETLIKLAALRTQYMVGDYEDGAYISDMIKVHPAQAQPLLTAGAGGIAGTLKKTGTLMKKAFKGTLKGLGSSTLRRLKGQGTIKKSDAISEEDLSKVKADIVNEWQKLKGLTRDDARSAYMDIIHDWNGYGANLFDVEQTSKKEWPKDLWLAISLEGVGIFPRGERRNLAFYRYESVLSFGAPVANKYKIMVDNVGSMLFETNMVLEIAKLMKEYIKEIVTRKS